MAFWVISLAGLGITILATGQSEIASDISQRNVQLASMISRDVNSQINAYSSDLRTFCSRLAISSPDLETQASEMLGLRLALPNRYFGIYYLDIEDNLLFSLTQPAAQLMSISDVSELINSGGGAPGADISQICGLTRGMVTYISDVHFTWLENQPAIYIGKLLNFPDGERRIAIFEISLEDIWQRINLATVGKTGYTCAVSQQGVFIAHPNKELVGQAIPPELKPVLMGYEGSAEFTDTADNKTVLAAYSPVGGPMGWGIVVAQDKSEANTPLARAGGIIGAVWLTLSAIGTLGIIVMVRNFAKPIVVLTKTADSITETGNLTTASLTERYDEVGHLSRAFNGMIQKLKDSEGRVASAATEERSRLARELHDAVSQTLFSASLIADVLPRIWERNPEEGRRRLDEVKKLTRGALAEMRTLLFELRPAALADADIGHLLRQLGESIGGRSRIPVTVEVDEACQLPVDVKISIYRITQEALNNVIKHSGASGVSVSLCREIDAIVLNVSDNGHGFDALSLRPESLGLKIMKERAEAVGAHLNIMSEPGRGTSVITEWCEKPGPAEQTG